MAIEVGNKVTGKVTGITKFGAFVDLGEGKNGLVHISEIAEGYVKDIHDVLSVGDEVTVLVTNVADDGKIALSIRRLNADGESKPATSNRGRNDGGGRDRGNQNFRKDDNRGGYQGKPKHNNHSTGRSNFAGGKPHKSNAGNKAATSDFDSMMSSFLKDSDDRLTSLKRNTEGKRGGRGGRRS
ncbi:S1 domain-containing RNA-binding protein [Aerococcaceae bacterium 50-4]